MVDELRAAAERRRTTPVVEGFIKLGQAKFRQRIEDACLLADAYLAGPAWHDRPPVPGTYIMQYPGSETMGTIRIIDPNIYHGAGCRWFGPIPADPTRGD